MIYKLSSDEAMLRDAVFPISEGTSLINYIYFRLNENCYSSGFSQKLQGWVIPMALTTNYEHAREMEVCLRKHI